jgi:hypothetical protein
MPGPLRVRQGSMKRVRNLGAPTIIALECWTSLSYHKNYAYFASSFLQLLRPLAHRQA